MPSFLNDQRLAALELSKRRSEQNNSTSIPDKASVEKKLDQPQTQTSWMSWLFGYFLF